MTNKTKKKLKIYDANGQLWIYDGKSAYTKLSEAVIVYGGIIGSGFITTSAEEDLTVLVDRLYMDSDTDV